MQLFAPCQCNFQLGQSPFIEEQADGYDGHSLVLNASLKFVEFAFVQKQFAFPQRFMVHDVAVGILTNVQRFHKEFTLVEIAVGIAQINPILAYGLDFRAQQLHAGREFIQPLVFKFGLSVLYVNRSRHGRKGIPNLP